MGIRVHLIHGAASPPWDRYVGGHPASTHYHRYAWKGVIKETYGHEPYYLAATVPESRSPSRGNTNELAIKGVLPLVHLDHFILGNRLVSLPYVDAAGILADNREIGRMLLEKAVDLGNELNSDYLELRQNHLSDFPETSLSAGHLSGFSESDYSMDDSAGKAETEGAGRENGFLPGFREVEVQIGHLARNSSNSDMDADRLPGKSRHIVLGHKTGLETPLPGTAEALFGAFPSKLRSQIRKALKNGFSAEIGGAELIDPFYAVLSVNMRDLGSPVHSRRLFQHLMELFPNDTRIVVIGKEGLPAAASIVIRDGNTLRNPWASSLRCFRPLSPNMLLYWTMLEYACKSGCTRFDFGRSTRGAGTHDFKRQWGAQSLPLSWHRFLLGNPPKFPRKESLNVNWWRKIPVTLSRLAGPALRKHISL